MKSNDILYGQWHDTMDQVRQKWVKLTDDDLKRLSGRIEELTGALQQRYDYDKARAELEIKEWLHIRGSTGKKEKEHG